MLGKAGGRQQHSLSGSEQVRDLPSVQTDRFVTQESSLPPALSAPAPLPGRAAGVCRWNLFFLSPLSSSRLEKLGAQTLCRLFVPFEFLIFCFAEFIAAICSFPARRHFVWCFSLGSVITFHISDRLLPHNFRLFSLFPPKGQTHNSENGPRSTEAVFSKPNFAVCRSCRAALPFIKVHLQSLMRLPQRDD